VLVLVFSAIAETFRNTLAFVAARAIDLRHSGSGPFSETGGD
jgi:hypothetical protein